MTKRKLLFLIGNYGTGGKERQLTEIIKGLPIDKYKLYLIMKDDCSFFFKSIKCYLDYYYSFEKKYFNLFDIIKLERLLKAMQPDVVFSFSSILSHYALLLELFGGFSYRLINGCIRNAPVDLNFQMKIDKILYNFYQEVVANSNSGLQVYGQTGKKGRHVLYNGFDIKRVPKESKGELRNQLGINDKFTVVMVASMGDNKDHSSIIRAADKILKINNDVQFYLVGDGPMKENYISWVSSLELDNNIIFTGEINNIEQYLKASDLSVLMSTNAEGFPNVVLESLACATPVIASQDGGTKELICNGINGYLINKGDYENLSSIIEYLYKNKETLVKLSYNADKTVRSNFSLKIMIRNFEEILDKKQLFIN